MKECTGGNGFDDKEIEVTSCREGESKEENKVIRLSLCIITPSLAFKMGLVSLAKFGALGDFLKWAKS